MGHWLGHLLGLIVTMFVGSEFSEFSEFSEEAALPPGTLVGAMLVTMLGHWLVTMFVTMFVTMLFCGKNRGWSGMDARAIKTASRTEAYYFKRPPQRLFNGIAEVFNLDGIRTAPSSPSHP